MVDFNSKIKTKRTTAPTNPAEIYDALDRSADKGPLRPAQLDVLTTWHTHHRGNRDVIVKLHTGQGKTLIGLLILQSKLNEGKGPALYLCPNTYLVEQTMHQAKQFGIKTITHDESGDLPVEFLNGESIYVTTSQKLFNGMTKFKLGAAGVRVGAMVLDDCHAITDAIEKDTSIILGSAHPLYARIVALFEPSLRHQGPGTLEEIKTGKASAVLKVPYWDLIEKAQSLTEILAGQQTDKAIAFAWPLLRDVLSTCDVFVSGDYLEITPIASPIQAFTSFAESDHRVFMSATVTDDSMLVRSLGVDRRCVENPITYAKEKWSGEKMILIPEIIGRDLTRNAIKGWLAKLSPAKQRYGIVVITTSKESALEWGEAGAQVIDGPNIQATVDALRKETFQHVAVFYNRYDGIDLPDAACRILVLDGFPCATSPSGRYCEKIDHDGSSLKRKIFRRIEQGLGRSVRGEKDYSIIILTGNKLASEIKSNSNRKLLSTQTQVQVEIGIEVSKYAQEDVAKVNASQFAVLSDVMGQLINRDPGWKDFYKDRMDAMPTTSAHGRSLDRYETEKKIDALVIGRQFEKAAVLLQNLIDTLTKTMSGKELGVLLESLAHLLYFTDKSRAALVQESAHKNNAGVLFPASAPAVVFSPNTATQADAIIQYARNFDDTHSLRLHIDSLVRQISFGQPADHFEESIRVLGDALGFTSIRPEKDYRAGPDNLWSQTKTVGLCIECKSEVDTAREEINKSELAQLLASTEWVRRNTGISEIRSIILIPTKRATREATASSDCRALTTRSLPILLKAIAGLYDAIIPEIGRARLNQEYVTRMITSHNLSCYGIFTTMCEEIKYHPIV